MYTNFIIITIVFTCFATYFAQGKNNSFASSWSTNENATKCYSCDSPRSCQIPTSVNCDQRAANATRFVLAQHFWNVANLTGTRFECIKINYSLKNTTVLAISGCVNAGLNACNLQPKNVFHATHICKSCGKALCNSAGIFSSSIAIVFSSVFAVMLLKC